VEAGSNTSTVTPRVVGGDEKGSLKSETVKYGPESKGTRIALARASSIHKRQTRPLVREGASQKQDRNCETVIKSGARHQDLLTDCQSQCDFDSDFEVSRSPVSMERVLGTHLL
jgi:hypothetical protein